MANPTGGSYALNPNTGEYELVERTLDPAEAVVVPEPAPQPVPEPEITMPAKRAAKITTEE